MRKKNLVSGRRAVSSLSVRAGEGARRKFAAVVLALMLWARTTRLQQLQPLLPPTNVFNKLGNLLFAQS